MKILAIETSCDETAAAVVEDGRKILSSVIASQAEEHKIYGGVVPEIASRRHAESISGVVRKALNDASCQISDLSAIGVTNCPGLIGALLVGVNFAKGLSYASKLPLVPVHHLRSHIAANYLCYPELEPPFLALVVSGGHTHLVGVKDYTSFEVIGQTMDDAAGEALDKAARAMGLPYPGGLNLDKYAEGGNPSAYKFPRPKVDNHPYDFSFSGLKTAAVNMLHKARQKGETLNMIDFAASYQSAVTDCLIDNLFKAVKNFDYNCVALAGGVSANSELRKRAIEICRNSKINLHIPTLDLCGDNAAMAASQAYYEFLSGNIAGLELNASAMMDIV